MAAAVQDRHTEADLDNLPFVDGDVDGRTLRLRSHVLVSQFRQQRAEVMFSPRCVLPELNMAVIAVLTPGIVWRDWAANWLVVVDLDSGRVEQIPLRSEGVFAFARGGSWAVIVVVVVQRVAVVGELRRPVGSWTGR